MAFIIGKRSLLFCLEKYLGGFLEIVVELRCGIPSGHFDHFLNSITNTAQPRSDNVINLMDKPLPTASTDRILERGTEAAYGRAQLPLRSAVQDPQEPRQTVHPFNHVTGRFEGLDFKTGKYWNTKDAVTGKTRREEFKSPKLKMKHITRKGRGKYVVAIGKGDDRTVEAFTNPQEAMNFRDTELVHRALKAQTFRSETNPEDHREKSRKSLEKANAKAVDRKAALREAMKPEPIHDKQCGACGEQFTTHRAKASRCPTCIEEDKPVRYKTCPNCDTKFAAPHGTEINCGPCSEINGVDQYTMTEAQLEAHKEEQRLANWQAYCARLEGILEKPMKRTKGHTKMTKKVKDSTIGHAWLEVCHRDGQVSALSQFSGFDLDNETKRRMLEVFHRRVTTLVTQMTRPQMTPLMPQSTT